MEIKLNSIYTENLSNLNVTLTNKQVIAILSENGLEKKEFFNTISGGEKIIKGNLDYSENISENKIYYLKENSNDMLFNINIKEDIKYYLNTYDQNKLLELLSSFDLNENILDKSYLEISNSEKRKILLIIGLLSNSKIILFENITISLDERAKETIIKHLKKLKREEKIIIISSHDSNFLLEVSDNIIVLDNKKIISYGNIYDVLSNKKMLEKINFKVPNTINFIHKIREMKNIKIGYRNNINDLIKDVFRHAK